MTASAETSTQPATGSGPRQIDTARVAELYRQLLTELGEDPGRDGLLGTPSRVATWWSEFLDYDLLGAIQGDRHRAGCVFAGERGFRGGSGCGLVACDDTVSVSDKGRPSPLPFREDRGGP